MTGQWGIYNFLKANLDIWFNIRDIAKLKDMNDYQVSKYLNKMLKFPKLFIGLEEKYEKDFREGKQYAIKYYRINVNIYKDTKEKN